jgi:hypothetical protein
MTKQSNYQKAAAEGLEYQKRQEEKAIESKEAGDQLAKLKAKYQAEFQLSDQEAWEYTRRQHRDLFATYMQS